MDFDQFKPLLELLWPLVTTYAINVQVECTDAKLAINRTKLEFENFMINRSVASDGLSGEKFHLRFPDDQVTKAKYVTLGDDSTNCLDN